MQDILEREWFTRVWTIQELAMAREPFVICGDKVIRWYCVFWGIRSAMSQERNDSIVRAWNAVSVADFFWRCLMAKQCIYDIEQSFGWLLKKFGAKSLRTTAHQLNTAGNISLLLALAQLGYVAAKRYAHGDRHLRCQIEQVRSMMVSTEHHCSIVLCHRSLTDVIEQIRVKLYDKGPSQPPSLPATSNDAWQPTPLCHDSDIRNIDITDAWALSFWGNLLRSGLLTALNQTRARHATVPRDKVFALFGVLKALGIQLDEPDYRDSTSEATVFLEFTRRIIEWQKSLDILIEVSNSPVTGAPTWVPDWSRPYFREDVSRYKAAGDSAPDFDLGDSYLETSGKVVDLVEDCFDNSPKGMAPSDLHSELPVKVHFTTKGERNGFSHVQPPVVDGPGPGRAFTKSLPSP
jgi:hypothetical protein